MALGPKTRVATPAMTTSSGTPNPNIQLQEKAGFLVVDLRFKGLKVLVKKDELEEDNRVVGGADDVRCEMQSEVRFMAIVEEEID